jgi:hypothetical protein
MRSPSCTRSWRRQALRKRRSNVCHVTKPSNLAGADSLRNSHQRRRRRPRRCGCRRHGITERNRFPPPPIRHSCASTPCPPRLQKLPPSHVDLTRSHLRQARCRHLIACYGVHERAKAGHWKGASENWMRRADGLGALLEAEQGDDPGQE